MAATWSICYIQTASAVWLLATPQDPSALSIKLNCYFIMQQAVAWALLPLSLRRPVNCNHKKWKANQLSSQERELWHSACWTPFIVWDKWSTGKVGLVYIIFACDVQQSNKSAHSHLASNVFKMLYTLGCNQVQDRQWLTEHVSCRISAASLRSWDRQNILNANALIWPL